MKRLVLDPGNVSKLFLLHPFSSDHVHEVEEDSGHYIACSQLPTKNMQEICQFLKPFNNVHVPCSLVLVSTFWLEALTQAFTLGLRGYSGEHSHSRKAVPLISGGDSWPSA